jgi:soluble lytic murein transglycosylase
MPILPAGSTPVNTAGRGDGKILQTPVRRRAFLFLAAGLGGVLLLVWFQQERREHSQDEPILAAARRYGVDPALVKAVVWRESRFSPSARGRVGERGLMQLRELAAQEWADAEKITGFEESSLDDPRTNTLAGTFYLAKLLRRYSQADDPVPFALADYNAGRGNVLKWSRSTGTTHSEEFMARIGFPETRKYVRAVAERRIRYQNERFGRTD